MTHLEFARVPAIFLALNRQTLEHARHWTIRSFNDLPLCELPVRFGVEYAEMFTTIQWPYLDPWLPIELWGFVEVLEWTCRRLVKGERTTGLYFDEGGRIGAECTGSIVCFTSTFSGMTGCTGVEEFAAAVYTFRQVVFIALEYLAPAVSSYAFVPQFLLEREPDLSWL